MLNLTHLHFFHMLLDQRLVLMKEIISTYNDHLNQQVHWLVSHFISEASSDTSASNVLDVDKFINSVQHVAPDVWEHVCLLTH